jgi:error-prone DNA polymerase
MYAELHALSNFSFLRGASQPEELIEQAKALGYRALALTDECSLAGVVRAHTEAKRCELPLIVGAELNCGADDLKLVALATDRASYGALCRLISRARRAGAKGTYRLERQDLENALDGCLILWLPPAGRILLPRQESDGRWLRERFAGRLWIGVELLTGGFDARRLALLETLGNALDLPRVAAGDVHMHRRGRRALQDALARSCIRTANGTCVRCRASRSCIRPRSWRKPCVWPSAARSGSTSCVTNIPRRSCPQARRPPVICAA